MTNNALSIYDGGRFDVMQRAAKAMVASGYFKDSKDLAQAVTKVMAGAELGIPPFAAMTGIHIIQGKPALGANLIATLVKNDPRYNYKVVKCDNEECIIDWFEGGELVGQSSFTFEEAKIAGLTVKDNWKRYTSDMLFARCITRGGRRFTPGIFGGAPIYTPDELGADIDPEGYIDAQSVQGDDFNQDIYPDEYSQTITIDGEIVEDEPQDTRGATAPDAQKARDPRKVKPETAVYEAEGFKVGDEVTINGSKQGIIQGFDGGTASISVNGKTVKAPFNLLELVTS